MDLAVAAVQRGPRQVHALRFFAGGEAAAAAIAGCAPNLGSHFRVSYPGATADVRIILSCASLRLSHPPSGRVRPRPRHPPANHFKPPTHSHQPVLARSPRDWRRAAGAEGVSVTVSDGVLVVECATASVGRRLGLVAARALFGRPAAPRSG